jgi:hypothetical protein
MSTRNTEEKGRERERMYLRGFLLRLLPLIYTPVESYNREEGNACIYNYWEWVWQKGIGITTKIWFLIILGCVSLVLIGGKWRLFYWFFLHYEGWFAESFCTRLGRLLRDKFGEVFTSGGAKQRHEIYYL